MLSGKDGIVFNGMQYAPKFTNSSLKNYDNRYIDVFDYSYISEDKTTQGIKFKKFQGSGNFGTNGIRDIAHAYNLPLVMAQ